MGVFAFSCNKVVTLKTVSVNTLGSPKSLCCDGQILVEKS